MNYEVGDWVRIHTPSRPEVEGRVVETFGEAAIVVADENASPPATRVTLSAQTLHDSMVTKSATR